MSGMFFFVEPIPVQFHTFYCESRVLYQREKGQKREKNDLYQIGRDQQTSARVCIDGLFREGQRSSSSPRQSTISMPSTLQTLQDHLQDDEAK